MNEIIKKKNRDSKRHEYFRSEECRGGDVHVRAPTVLTRRIVHLQNTGAENVIVQDIKYSTRRRGTSSTRANPEIGRSNAILRIAQAFLNTMFSSWRDKLDVRNDV